MTIYDLKNKDLKKYFREFAKTTYGKVVFCLAYIVPFIMTIVCTETALLCKMYCGSFFGCNSNLPLYLIITLISFVVGSAYFYREFDKFLQVKYKDK